MSWVSGFKRRFIYGPTGHAIVCRLMGWVVQRFGGSISHCAGPDGSQFCFYAMECLPPTKEHMDITQARLKAFHTFSKLLTDEGVLVSHVWENPRFKPVRLCNCGNENEKKLTHHNPLCAYRERWGAHPTREEYAAVLQRGQIAH